MRSGAMVVAVGALACAGLATVADAARDREPVDVARSGEVTLTAEDDDGELCLELDELERECADPDQGVVVGGDAGEPRYLGVAVPAASARVEVRRAGVLLVAGPTVAGAAYEGRWAGSVRFALLLVPKARRTDGLRIRALTATGSLVAVLAPDHDADLVLGRTRLLSGRARDMSWSIVAEQRSELTPSALDLGHETPSRCVVTAIDGVDRGQVCENGLPLDSLGGLDVAQATGTDACNPQVRLLHGVVDGSVASVSALLGNGARRTVRTVPVGDGRRAYGLLVGGSAVRSVTLAGGRVIRPALPPVSVVCSDGGFLTLLLGNVGNGALGPFQLLLDLPPVTPSGPVATIPGSPAMQVADGPADSLCITLAGQPFGRIGCGILSPFFSDQLIAYDDLLNAHAVALAVPARVAAVRLSSSDRKLVRTIPTDAGAEYRGRYAGHVRFAAASFANADAFTRLEWLDARGAVLHQTVESSDDEVATPRVGPARRVAGRAGRPSLWQTNVRRGTDVQRCLSLTDGPAPGPDQNCQASRSDATMLLEASCVTRRLSVAIAVRPGTRVALETGGAARRPVRLRRGLAVLTLPSGRRLRSVRFTRRGRARRVGLGVPPAARQCGWRFAPDVEDL